MKQTYIAVYGLSNNAGIGITEIDYSMSIVNFEVVVGDKIVDIINTEIVDRLNEEEEYETGFYWGLNFIPFSECIRTDI